MAEPRLSERGWYWVTSLGDDTWGHAPMGASGFLEAYQVASRMPEPTAHLALVRPGDMLKDLAARHYKHNFKWGHDARVYVQAIYHRNSGRLEKAGDTLAKLVTTDTSLAAIAQNLLAEIEMELWRPEQAEASLRRSLSLRDTARAHLLLARLALTRGDLLSASREAERARSLDPSDPDLADLEDALAAPR